MSEFGVGKFIRVKRVKGVKRVKRVMALALALNEFIVYRIGVKERDDYLL